MKHLSFVYCNGDQLTNEENGQQPIGIFFHFWDGSDGIIFHKPYHCQDFYGYGEFISALPKMPQKWTLPKKEHVLEMYSSAKLQKLLEKSGKQRFFNTDFAFSQTQIQNMAELYTVSVLRPLDEVDDYPKKTRVTKQLLSITESILCRFYICNASLQPAIKVG